MKFLSHAELLDFYRRMVGIRRFEEAVARLSRQGQVPGFVHVSSGGEAVAVGIGAALSREDVLYSGHRAHGHALAKGVAPAPLLAEIMGKATGLCQGRAGSMHVVDAAVGFWGATGIVGGTIPLALGTAYGLEPGRIAVVMFGDGASTTGLFHECLNLAALWSLPVLFCCENNGIAEFTDRAEQSPVAEVAQFAAVYGMDHETLDGYDVEAVWAAAERAVASVRKGRPFFLEFRIERLSGHYEGDAQSYRGSENSAALPDKDPVRRLKERLVHEFGVAEADLNVVEKEEQAAVQAAVAEASAAPLAAAHLP